MQLDKVIAQNIVKRTMSIINCSVNVMDHRGVIIASGNPARLNQLHTGAVLALRQDRIVEVDEKLAEKWNFEAQPGINVPIQYLGHNIGVIGVSGVPEQVKSYAELVKMTAELIVEQHILLEKESWNRRYKEEFILQLVKGNLSLTEMEEQAKFFSFSLTIPRVVIIIKLLKPSIDSLQHLVSYLEQPQFEQEVAILSLDQIIILQPFSIFSQFDKQLKKLLPEHYSQQDYKIAIGAHLERPVHEQLHVSYRTAMSTLYYGLKRYPRKTLYAFEEYRLPVLLAGIADSWQAEELLKPLKGLFQQENAQLLKTLQYYFLSNCDLTLTAQKLFIHPNTLRYRLAKIEQVTNLSFNKIEDKLSLYLSTVLA